MKIICEELLDIKIMEALYAYENTRKNDQESLLLHAAVHLALCDIKNCLIDLKKESK